MSTNLNMAEKCVSLQDFVNTAAKQTNSFNKAAVFAVVELLFDEATAMAVMEAEVALERGNQP